MNQIYNFEQHKPPVLNENMLRAELERRRLRWQTALVAVAGTLLLIAAAMLGFLVLEDYPWITASVSGLCPVLRYRRQCSGRCCVLKKEVLYHE